MRRTEIRKRNAVLMWFAVTMVASGLALALPRQRRVWASYPTGPEHQTVTAKPGADGLKGSGPVPPPAGPASRPGFLLRRDGETWLWVGTEPVATTAEVVRRFDAGATAWELAALYGVGPGVVTEAIVHERRRAGRR